MGRSLQGIKTVVLFKAPDILVITVRLIFLPFRQYKPWEICMLEKQKNVDRLCHSGYDINYNPAWLQKGYAQSDC